MPNAPLEQSHSFCIEFLFPSYCLQTLYASGARKFIIPSIGNMGCLPLLLVDGKLLFGDCNQDINAFSVN